MDATIKNEVIRVAVGVIRNHENEVLVSRRKPNTHLGNMLEIPGGKVEQGEQPLEALKRELEEELAIQVVDATQLIQVPYQYSKCSLLLDVFEVHEFTGTIKSNEGQDVFWKSIAKLNDAEFPEANSGILRAIKLPKIFPVTPNYSDDQNYFEHFENIVSDKDIEIIQLRSHDLEEAEYNLLAKRCAELCKKHSVKLVLNREISSIENLEYSGVHLTSENLNRLTKRPLADEVLVGASCHNAKEIEKANTLKLDYVFIGAVNEKNNVNNHKKLGWDGFAALAKECAIPAYAIGGMLRSDTTSCGEYGAQGVAAIRSFWDVAD